MAGEAGDKELNRVEQQAGKSFIHYAREKRGQTSREMSASPKFLSR